MTEDELREQLRSVDKQISDLTVQRREIEILLAAQGGDMAKEIQELENRVQAMVDKFPGGQPNDSKNRARHAVEIWAKMENLKPLYEEIVAEYGPLPELEIAWHRLTDNLYREGFGITIEEKQR